MKNNERSRNAARTAPTSGRPTKHSATDAVLAFRVSRNEVCRLDRLARSSGGAITRARLARLALLLGRMVIDELPRLLERSGAIEKEKDLLLFKNSRLLRLS